MCENYNSKTVFYNRLEFKAKKKFASSKAVMVAKLKILLLKTNGNRVTMSDYFIYSKDEDEPKKLQL